MPDETYRAVNAGSVRTLIEAAAKNGVRRVVHCSTVGVHGDVEHPPANEDAPLRPGDIYQRTKVEGEAIARQASARTGVEVVIARPTGIYGPGDRRLLKLFRGVARRRFVILGSGRIYYHLTYIDDLVEGFRLCGTVPAAAGRTYILAGGEVTTLDELVARIASAAGVQPIRVAPAGVAVLAGGRDVRSGLRAVQDLAAALSPAGRFLHQEPRLRHHAGAAGTGIRAGGGPDRRHHAHAGRGTDARVGSDGGDSRGRRISCSTGDRRRATSTRAWSSAGPVSARC